MTNSFKLNKKTLIISSWAPPMVGGPQNLYNLFSQFSKDSYCILTSEKNIASTVESGVSGNWLPCQYFYYDNAGLLAAQKTPSPIQTAAQSIPKTSLKQRATLFISKIPFVGKVLHDYLGAIYFIRLLIRRTKQTIIDSRAENLMGISDAGPSLITVWLVSRITKIPYTIYLFDIYKGNLLPRPYKFFAKLLEKLVMTHASRVLVTNEGTEAYYKQQYGNNIKTAVIYNSTFADQYEKVRTPYQPRSPYRIVFTGNVYWAQEQSVLNLVSAMELLTDIPVELHLYVPKPTEKLQSVVVNKANIKLLAANQSEMPKIQSDAALLFLPLAWNTESPDIIATATPGKFTDYLASGRPMLIHAPDYAYVSQYSKKHQIALVVDQNDTHLLADTIRKFLQKPEDGQRYIQNAIKIFNQNHDAVKNAEKLANILNAL